MKFKPKIILLLIILLASAFRFYGFDWDSGQHLHPDERFLTMVATAIQIPPNFSNYFNPQQSVFSPYNNGYSFFVYGTLPLNLVKIIGQISGYIDYGSIHFVGRILSAIFDIAIIFLLYIIVKKILNTRTALLAALFYAVMVLPIQLSHFFAVDTFLNFFLLLSFYFLLQIYFSKRPFLPLFFLSLSFAAALACKISALYFSPIIAIIFILSLIKQKNHRPGYLLLLFLFPLLTPLVFRFLQPHIFLQSSWLNWHLHPQFISNLQELQYFSDPNSWFPPAIQWKGTTPIIFPLKNIILWGLGLPLGLLFLSSMFSHLFHLCVKNIPLLIIHLWILMLLIYQGSQMTKTMRYFLPIYPYIAIVTAAFISRFKLLRPQKYFVIFFLILLIYPISFMSIYSHPVTRLTASDWIYQNIPFGSVLAVEHWDDGLPLNLPGHLNSSYPSQSLALYDPDTPQKWQEINRQLAVSDYIILSSNRLYAPIPKNSDHYPQTTRYYRDLFAGSLGFSQIAQFSSYPCFPPLGHPWFCVNDDSAEEAFTVYDHPKVLIFKKDH